MSNRNALWPLAVLCLFFTGRLLFADTLIYRYDDLNRLTRLQVPSQYTIDYAYDDVNNILNINVTPGDATAPVQSSPST